MNNSSLRLPYQDFLTIDELSLRLKVSKKTIYRWVGQRQIPFLKLQRHLRFELSVVIEHFKQRSSEQMKACAPSFDLLFASHSARSHRSGSRSLKTSEIATLPSLRKGDKNGN